MTAENLPIGRSALAALTEGVTLPLQPLPEHTVEILGLGIATACERVQLKTLQGADEPAINAELEARFRRLAREDPKLRMLVSSVTRGAESINYDGSSIELRPDLVIYLSQMDFGGDFPLTVECKIIDHHSRKGVEAYCNNGLQRFVNGEYAWERKEAFMLAYVRDCSAIDPTLRNYLVRHKAAGTDPFATVSEPHHLDWCNDGAESVHRRSFSYPTVSSDNGPGDISIRHIWFSCSR